MKYQAFHLGQSFTTETYTVSAEELHHFAARYDPQRLHLDEEYARRGPFGEIIAPGHLTLAIAWGLFARMGILGEDSRGGIGLEEVRWPAPVCAGDTLTAEVEITALRRTSKGDKGLLTLDFTLKNQHGATVVTFKSLTFVATESGGAAPKSDAH